MNNDDYGHWWNDPFGYSKILRAQGLLDEDELVIEATQEEKTDLRKFQEELRKEWCVGCCWEFKDRQRFPCDSCNRNLDAKHPEKGDAYIRRK
jgi:hypothetical protein